MIFTAVSATIHAEHLPGDVIKCCGTKPVNQVNRHTAMTSFSQASETDDQLILI